MSPGPKSNISSKISSKISTKKNNRADSPEVKSCISQKKSSPILPEKNDTKSEKSDKTDKKYRFAYASHPMKLDPTGCFVVDKEMVQPFALNFKKHINKAPGRIRKLSATQFEENLASNIMIRWIQDRAYVENLRIPGPQTQKRNFLNPAHLNRSSLLKFIDSIAKSAEEIFQSEPRVLRLDQPTIVFGDMHGNLSDLMLYESVFWKENPSVMPWNYLFLGDYVDRSIYSLETILYLLCQKISARNKFFLVRGNHEFRNINRMFGFFLELTNNFGPEDGEKIWQRLNRVFDYMPMCAIIAGKVFCCHGGIPLSPKTGMPCEISELEAITCPYEGPREHEDPSGPAWELVWNDPLSVDEWNDALKSLPANEKEIAQKTGFAVNTKRSTGRFFNDQATRHFLSANDCDFILRGHECVHHGYMSTHDGLTMTLFSSSGYSGNNNAAVIMVHDGKIRPIKMRYKDERPTNKR